MIDKDCTTCKFEEGFALPCYECAGDTWHWEPKKVIVGTSDSISFPILNNLTPNLHSCTLKVIEEVGELMQLLGKGQGLSGEVIMLDSIDKSEWAIRTIAEALDTAQSATTMAHALSEKYHIDIGVMMELHKTKLIERGYLR